MVARHPLHRVAAASPSVTQVRAATPGENYLDHLPFTYARDDQRKDGSEGFLCAC